MILLFFACHFFTNLVGRSCLTYCGTQGGAIKPFLFCTAIRGGCVKLFCFTGRIGYAYLQDKAQANATFEQALKEYPASPIPQLALNPIQALESVSEREGQYDGGLSS